MKTSIFKKVIFIVAALFASMTMNAQDINISGSVVDTGDEPLIGATIFVKGTKTATTTDLDGKYTIKAPKNGILVVSYVGFQTQEVSVDARNQITITMTDTSKDLSELVVVGYGEQKKVNLTGAVSAINVKDLQESRPMTNMSQVLSGQAAGVRVTMGSNQPGDDTASFRIRGVGTLNSSSPLVIIDGVEAGISSVNPQDVEAVSVLKDAASASIYGSRAANGVILITTKKGDEGKVKVSYNGFVSFQSVKQNIHPVTDYATYMGLINEGYKNAGYGDYYIYSQNIIDEWRTNTDAGADPILYPNNDWFDMTFRNATMNNHTVSISGGTKKIKIYGSFGYLDNPGVMQNSGFKRYNARMTMDAEVTKWLNVGMQASGYLSDRQIAGGDLVDDVFSSAYATSPGITFELPDGRFGASPNPEEAQSVSSNNPIARLYRSAGGTRANSIKPRFYAKISPFKGFTLTGSYTMNFLTSKHRSKPQAVDYYDPSTDEVKWKYDPQSKLYYSNSQSYRYFNDIVARYENTIAKKLDLAAMVGMSNEQYSSSSFSATRQDLVDESLWDLAATTGDATVGGTSSEWAMRSYFGRLNLCWDSKYLLELNLRVDGSSRFSKDNRWGWFPSASAGWRMEQEAFMQPLVDKFLNNLKLRASYGSLGNNAVGNYEYQSLYTNSGMYYVLNDTKVPGMAQKALANDQLTWEHTYVANVGLDFGVLSNRLTGTIDAFHKRTSNILISLPAPLVHGNRDVPTVNAAEVTNKGIEVTLGWKDRIQDFTYGVSANFTYIKNMVTKYKGPGEDGRTISSNMLIWEGHPYHAHYLLVADRILQTDEDMQMVQNMIDNAPLDENGNKLNPFATYGKPERGDLFYKDINGDGIIDLNDRKIVTDGTMPKYNIGLNLDAGWRGIDFSVLFDASLGGYTYWNSKYYSTITAQGNMINQKVADGRWYEGRETPATYPRLYPSSGTKVNEKASTFYLYKLDFLKIRNIQLGYSLPKKWITKAGFSKVRVYASMENFFTFTKYPGFDPETGTAYPVMRQMALGLNVSF